MTLIFGAHYTHGTPTDSCVLWGCECVCKVSTFLALSEILGKIVLMLSHKHRLSGQPHAESLKRGTYLAKCRGGRWVGVGGEHARITNNQADSKKKKTNIWLNDRWIMACILHVDQPKLMMNCDGDDQTDYAQVESVLSDTALIKKRGL